MIYELQEILKYFLLLLTGDESEGTETGEGGDVDLHGV